MQLPQPLYPGRLIRRYKRFLADIELASGAVLTVHCPNPGRMTGLQAPGSPVWLSKSGNPGRKLSHTLELLETPGGLVGINTGRPNLITVEAIRAGAVPQLAGYPVLRQEVRSGDHSRIDILLEDPARGRCWVEVKNVHLRPESGPDRGAAAFPDAVTARGARHLRELAALARGGDRAVIFFLVQRMDCDRFTIAGDIDPVYRKAFVAAIEDGVEPLCFDTVITTREITLRRRLPVLPVR